MEYLSFTWDDFTWDENKSLFDYHSSSVWPESGIPSLSMLEFIDQKIKEMNAG
jgi:hypothetical protein